MKKLLLVSVFMLLTFNIFSQVKINTDDLIGYWMPDEESTQLFFWRDVNGVLQTQEISGTNGEPLVTRDFRINEESVMIKTLFITTNWTTINYFTFADKDTLKCVTTGSGNGTIYYRRAK